MSEHSASLSFLNSFVNFESRLNRVSSGDFSLEPVKQLLRRLGHPEKGLRIIHVAGTKGKGSTAVMIASILREAGFSAGLYTSPHMYDVTERIRILRPGMDSRSSVRGQLFSDSISDQDFDAVIQKTRAAIEDIHRSSSRGLTFFEVLTALALCHFAEERADWVVLETGLGGRLDATNAVDSLAAVITPVSFDHQNILGRTLAEIAMEKAGIIKRAAQKVVIAPQAPEAMRVIRRQCACVGVESVRVDPSDVSVLGDMKLSLSGDHQRLNALTAVHTLEALDLNIQPETLSAALCSVFWPGRFEIIARHPAVIVDCAHNEDSMRALLKTAEETFSGRKPYFILGVSQDKDLDGITRLLQNNAQCVILTKSGHPRARSFEAADVQRYFSGGRVVLAETVAQAMKTVRAAASAEDVIIVAGSVFVAAEARKNHV